MQMRTPFHIAQHVRRAALTCAVVAAVMQLSTRSALAQGPTAGLNRSFVEHHAPIIKAPRDKSLARPDSAAKKHANPALIGAAIGCAAGLTYGIPMEIGDRHFNLLSLLGICGLVAIPTTVIAALLFPRH